MTCKLVREDAARPRLKTQRKRAKKIGQGRFLTISSPASYGFHPILEKPFDIRGTFYTRVF